MKQHRLFGTDGIRGKVGSFPITADFILKLGWAAGRVLARHGSRKVILGKDTRISGYMLESALEAGLAAAGLSAALTGPMPTPAIAYLTRTFRAEAGIVISASHNPYDDNGIKFFSTTGTKVPLALETAIEQELARPMTCVASEVLGRASRMVDAAGRYIEFCKSGFPNEFDLSGLHIVVDCAHGATYHIAPNVFRELGARVTTLGCEPNGLNINVDCGATDIQALQHQVLSLKADIGIAFDGDGDRVIMVDHQGQRVDGDQILYIIAQDLHQQQKLPGGVVGTLMSNMGLEIALQRLGIAFERSAVGDRAVLEKLQTLGWRLGAENSGHVILLDKSTTGDGIVAALQVLAAMIQQGNTLLELCQGIRLFPQILVNIPLSEHQQSLQSEPVKQVVHRIERQLAGRGRIVLRQSGTEPLVRVMVEGEDQPALEQMAHRVVEAVTAN
ncbi:MAG: phosphoglucosamine mutase [Candidatus Symbiodolus clandestinus]